MARGGGCRDERRGSSASEVGTDDGTATTTKKVPEFLEILTSTAAQAEITHARAIVSTDINLAIHSFVECLKKASACMVRRIKVGGTRKSAEWFDQDCFIHRKQCVGTGRRDEQRIEKIMLNQDAHIENC